ncbi:hypothetical protein [Pelagibacterium mangrovi]|uniref:hypothetical protein n=1 Tax=Pelagibacterium mangrovi TaxID=3119828 RepID=UPI002FC7356E
MVKTIHTSDHPAAQIPGQTIANLFAEWLEVRERTDELCRAGDDEALQISHARYVELQQIITDHMSPVTAKDLAMQIVVEMAEMESDGRDEFWARLLAFAKRPSVHPSEDEREAKFETALTAFRDAAIEYDPTILSFWVSRSEGDQPGHFTNADGVMFCRSRASENRTAQARGELA